MTKVEQTDFDPKEILIPGLENLKGPITLKQKQYIRSLRKRLNMDTAQLNNWTRAQASREINNLVFKIEQLNV